MHASRTRLFARLEHGHATAKLDMPTAERAKWHNQAHARRAANVTHFGSCDNLSSLVLSLQELLDASRGLRTNHEARTGQETDEARRPLGHILKGCGYLLLNH